MNIRKERVAFQSLGDVIAGFMLLPDSHTASPALLICHGAGEYKENYEELAHYLALKGVAALAIDMHGHGESQGDRFHVKIEEWVADVRAGIDFLSTHPRIDPSRIGAFGLSSGGTAILEAALIEPRLRALVALGATVRNSLPLPMSLLFRLIVALGRLKGFFLKGDLRLPLAKLAPLTFASDPAVNRRLCSDSRALEAYMAFPFPGAAQAFFVDTITRVPRISVPTLIIWGGDDKMDPPKTAQLLFEALTCPKRLAIISGNGHAGHLDRHRERVFALTSDWALEHLA